MAFCAKCGAQLKDGSAFCAACGAATGQSTSAASGAAAAPAPAPTAAATGMSNNAAACLSYLFGWITGLIFLLIEPYKRDRFVRFHAFQSIFFNVAVIGLYIALAVLSGILGVITHGMTLLVTGPLFMLLWLAIFVCWIFLMVKAYGNQEFKLPFIGDLAAKQADSM